GTSRIVVGVFADANAWSAKDDFRSSSGSVARGLGRGRGSDCGDFRDQYARAREAQAGKFFNECIEIADTAKQENCNVARLRVDTRKWAAARLAPRKYGDQVQHEHKGGVTFQPQILIQCSSGENREYEELYVASEAAGGAPQQGNRNLVRGR